MSSDLSDDAPGDLYILHEAADAGDVDALRQLLEERAQQLAQRQQHMQTDEAGDEEDDDPLMLLGPGDDPYLQGKDQSECTPLHVAILRGHVECARVLVEAQADVQADCDGCPALILAICTAVLPGREAAAGELVQLLLDAGADPMQRDDYARLPLHWAAELGLPQLCNVLLAATAAAAAQLTERVAAAAAADAAAGQPQEALEAPNVLEMQDTFGNNVLHCAARYNQPAVLQQLLASAAAGPAAAAADGQEEQQQQRSGLAQAALHKNRDGFTPLALAAYHGSSAAAGLLAAAHPPAAAAADKRGHTPAQLAARRGFTALAAALEQQEQQQQPAAAAGAALPRAPTLIVAPPECQLHFTCPDPLPRGMAPPPENVDRLRVLVDEGRGILRGSRLAALLEWELSVPPAPLADVLRVHDWNYVRELQAVCRGIPDRPDAQALLDPDTAVSHHTYQVALRAAASVCLAIDRVVSGAASNAFCAVRPPGHHAGPRGVVPSKKDRTGSHGFCLLNNLAIGAAYAMNVHRHRGIQRVALLDFDVHHGNGTRACVSNTAPAVLRVPFHTPLSEGVHVYHTYAPWFDADDDDNVLFASVQGYGPKSSSRPDVYVYPGSGATCDTQEVRGQQAKQPEGGAADGDGAGEAAAAPQANGGAAAAPATGEVKQEAGADAAPAHSAAWVEEDPNHEFASSTADDPPSCGPRLIEVGIPGPGFHPLLWRRAWRDKVLPAVVNFKPDLILVSAGFDAHKKDAINYRYIGVTEADYEWLTDQIVQVANRCCGGRVVSVLEGGYNINGGLASAFARSVEAHVRGLAEPHAQVWDPQEARVDREQEQRRKEERAARVAAKKAAAQERLRKLEAAEAAAAAGAAAAGAGDGAPAAAAADAGAAGGEAAAAGGGGRSKRRRTSAAVDYAALNAEMEAAAAAARAPNGGADA